MRVGVSKVILNVARADRQSGQANGCVGQGVGRQARGVQRAAGCQGRRGRVRVSRGARCCQGSGGGADGQRQLDKGLYQVDRRRVGGEEACGAGYLGRRMRAGHVDGHGFEHWIFKLCIREIFFFVVADINRININNKHVLIACIFIVDLLLVADSVVAGVVVPF